MSIPSILIRKSAPDRGYDVVVQPQIVPDGEGWKFRDHHDAMEWAARIHQQNGAPVIDKTGGGHE
jgi:hypothetical protein